MLRAALILILLSGGSAWSQPQPIREAQLQSALVLRLLNFVDWPIGVESTGAPLRLCVQTNALLGQALRSSVNPAWRDVAIKVDLLDSSDTDYSTCQALVLEHNSLGPPPPQQIGLLTIGVGDGFVQRGGMVSIVLRNNRYSFDVNLDVAKQARLRLETTLVQLAHTVVYSR